ncbi:MAG: radical SAM protein [bacterium]|nr:radical SAM protein [bacterium]
MKRSDLFTVLLPYLTKYKLHRWLGYKKFNPMTLTYSVTAACQSRCKTCQIGAMFCQDPTRPQKDLKLDEIEKIFKTMRPVYFFNMSGGEPFMRDDLPEIVELACKYLKPRVVHTPTNAILTDKIIRNTEKIIQIVQNYDATVPVTVKPSIDGVGDKHDEIRGIKGNFQCLLKTIEGLKKLEEKYNNFHLELGTVISNFNIDDLDEIENFVHSLGVESYRNEVAECRTEFFNLDDPITPPAETYQRLIKDFARKVEENIGKKKKLARTTEAMRVVYYDLAGKILEEKRQVIPCYAGVSNVHINYDGGVWPCCVLGYNQEMGNLREYDYDFQKLWHSSKANEVRKYIKNKNCACPLANQAYSNELLHLRTLIKVGIKAVQFGVKG